nr:hypothetical protein CFP56_57541 [Quercus suber]
MENLKGKASNRSAEQDLDKFLLGDLEDSDGGAANLASQDLLINIKFTIPLSMILSLDQFILWIFGALQFSR